MPYSEGARYVVGFVQKFWFVRHFARYASQYVADGVEKTCALEARRGVDWRAQQIVHLQTDSEYAADGNGTICAEALAFGGRNGEAYDLRVNAFGDIDERVGVRVGAYGLKGVVFQ